MLTDDDVADALLGMVAARFTQSNSVVIVRDGMTVGIGAGQQSRIDCTQLAGAKARTWWMRRHHDIRTRSFAADLPRQDRLNRQIVLAAGTLAAHAELTGLTMVSDGYLPFRDNVDVAAEHGVTAIVEPGGALHGDVIADACRQHGIRLIRTNLRLFHH